MRKKLKKKLLFGASVLALLTPLTAIVACGEASENDLSAERRREFKTIRNGPFLSPRYEFDNSASYGNSNEDAHRIDTRLFRLQTFNEPQFTQEGNKLVISQASYSKYTFEYAQKVILHLTNGTKVEFDSDDIDPVTSETYAKNPNKISFQALSSNPKSINSLNFINYVSKKVNSDENVASFEVTIKDNVFWTDDTNTKTQYQVVANDFYYSYARSNLLTASNRQRGQEMVVDPNGKDKNELVNAAVVIDREMRSNYNIQTRFGTGPRDYYSNGYLFEIFGVDLNDITARSFSAPQDKNPSFVLNAIDKKAGANFADFFTKVFINNLVLSGAPSQYIDATKAGVDELNLTYKPKIGTLAYEFGIYNYALEKSNTLFGGAYVPIVNSQVERTKIFVKNTNYVDQEFLNNTQTINKIVLEFDPSSATIYSNTVAAQFKNKKVDQINYDILNEGQKSELNSFVRVTRKKYDNKFFGRTWLTTSPFPGGDIDEYTYNDAYSKLIYGNTISELSAGKALLSQGNSNYYKGNGLLFRSILQSAVNFYALVEENTRGTAYPWPIAFAPDGDLNGSDAKTSPYKTLYTDPTPKSGPLSITNSKGEIVDSIIGNKINEFMLLDANDFSLVDVNNYIKDFDEYINKIIPDKIGEIPTIADFLKSSIFTKSKAQMKILLDNFYSKNPQLNGQNIKWEIVWSYTSEIPNITATAFANLVSIIKELDPRLEPSFVTTSTFTQLFAKVIKGFGASQFNGWGYDYNGIGTALDGISHGDAIQLVSAFSLFANLDPNNSNDVNLNKLFPMFTKLSKWLQKEITSEASLFVNDENNGFNAWQNFNNTQLTDLEHSIKFKTDPVTGASLSSTSLEFAKLFIDYQITETNENLLLLIREINTLKGNSLEVLMNDVFTVAKPNSNTKILLQKRFENLVPDNGEIYQQDILIAI